ncbi:serine/threonine protein kinase [Magnaporthiopsis poae ATCC 64411]|uniref:Serine/threonine protein kinase n=1 Tax=Magnaporthiopsis poae (strain ATCC 64411 / 73-15) TaxID=644358 RepID=A0A0C4DN07_MAGP6|nr:serine/threonine protein kinase [Magnaporthiopsis poae ATCC 64411]
MALSGAATKCEGLLTDAHRRLIPNRDVQIELENILVRFNVWAGNVGVFAPAAASLDSRLRDYPDLAEVILSMLKSLQNNVELSITPPLLEEPEEMSDGGPPDQEGTKESVRSTDEDGSSGSSSSAAISIDSEAEGSDTATHGSPEGTHIKKANEILDRLYRMVSVIRKPISSGENTKVHQFIAKLRDRGEIKELDDIEDHARSHLEARFKNKISAVLTERLVAAVVFRRMKLLYRQRHQQKLRQGAGPRTESHFQHPGGAASTASGWPKHEVEQMLGSVGDSLIQGDRMPIHTNHQAGVAPSKVMSDTDASSINKLRLGNYAKSVALSGITQAAVGRRRRLDVPSPPPSQGAGSEMSECPFCFRMISPEEKEEPRWTRHILKDIDPYVCLFEGCGEGDVLFKSADDWLSHMQWQHTKVWTCQACQVVGHEHQAYSSAFDMEQHIRRDHPGSFTEAQLPDIVQQSSLPAPDTFAVLMRQNQREASDTGSNGQALHECPICMSFHASPGSDAALPLHESANIHDHILEHLESIALLSLPINDDQGEGLTTPNSRQSKQDEDADWRKKSDLPPAVFDDIPGQLRESDDSELDAHNSSLIDSKWAEVFEQLHVDSGPVHWEGYPSVPKYFHKTLQQEIFGGILAEPKGLPHNRRLKGFLPLNKLGELITRETVEKELIFHSISVVDASKLSAKIVDISSPLTSHPGNYEKTTRRKLFAILVMMDKVLAIVDFIQENILDRDLPFVYQHTPGKPRGRSTQALLPILCRKCVPPGGGDASMVPVKSMESWIRMEIEYFHDNQWTMLAPFLQLSNPGAPKVHHYPLDYHSILPFVGFEGPDDALDGLMEMQEITGGFSVVHRIQIHEHHHNLFDPTAPERERNPYFAVKILREGTSKETFEQEVNCLKRLMEANNPSLVRLLGTLNHNNHYYLIFPWADANLEEFMAREYPNLDSPPRDASLARWVSKQLSSLASGLKLVHSSPIREDNKQEMPPVSEKIYGRHGDIKPANILFFRSRDPQSGGGWSLGTFKISDFGFTEFHSLKSIVVPAHAVGRSPTHKAPECDGTSVSPSSDLWSLGAVMLELMVWYISGLEGYNAFNQRRRDDDTEIMFDRPAQDKYFNNITAPGVAKVKQSVQKEIDDIRSHERCSAFIRDVVDFIGNHLLVVKPQDRADTCQLLETMEAINKRCLDSEDYCSSPIVGRHNPAFQVTGGVSSSPGSEGNMTTKTPFLPEDSSFTHQATVTREATGLTDPQDKV